jgi:hypothetical protein
MHHEDGTGGLMHCDAISLKAHPAQMTNDEAGMTNETAMANDEKAPRRTTGLVIAVSSFIRHSGFVIRHSFGECPAFSETSVYDVGSKEQRSKEQWMSGSSSPASAARA